MRVAVLYATDFAHISPGGIQNFIMRVGRFAPSDMEVEYFGMGMAESLPRPTDRFHSLGNVGAEKVNRTFLRGLRSVRSSLARDYDVLVAHRVEHVLALPRRSPLALTLHGGSWNAIRAANRTFGLAYPAVEAIACARADSVLSVDAASHTRLAKRLARPIEPIATPASEEFRSPVRPPRRSDVLLTASRLVPEKRIDRLISLAGRSGRRLVVFGDGPHRPALERTARAVAADVDFRGEVDSRQLTSEYRKGGIFCLGSAFEGYPLAAVEAAASGLPVLGVASQGVRQLAWLGAVSTASVDEAAEVIEQGGPSPIDPEKVWQTHAPEYVAAKFWGRVRSLA